MTTPTFRRGVAHAELPVPWVIVAVALLIERRLGGCNVRAVRKKQPRVHDLLPALPRIRSRPLLEDGKLVRVAVRDALIQGTARKYGPWFSGGLSAPPFGHAHLTLRDDRAIANPEPIDRLLGVFVIAAGFEEHRTRIGFRFRRRTARRQG